MKKISPVENIIHKTGSSPFSIHKTLVGPETENALYFHCHVEAEFFYLERGRLDLYIESECFRLLVQHFMTRKEISSKEIMDI